MQLRWYQQEAVAACWDFLGCQSGNPLIDLPTGAGKSLVLSQIAKDAIEQFDGRVVVVAHRKELLTQNAAKISLLTNKSIGIYSAGLHRTDVGHDIVLAGIQSVYSKAHLLGRRHLLIIDEAHLVPRSGDGMYQQFICDLAKYNSGIRVVGLTATPFRLDSGKLWGSGELFSHVCYRGDIRRLIDEGFLCRITNQPTTQADTSKLHTRAGEFVRFEVEKLFGDAQLIEQTCQELVRLSMDRKSILVFCSGVDHAEAVQNRIESITGERVECVTGETPPLTRQAVLDSFDRGEYRWLVNVDVLTTGFDSPRIDCVAIVRATQSAGLFCQMVGRGLRTHPDKKDALLLDFGGNLDRHGPIDAVDFGEKKPKGNGVASERPEKVCPGCDSPVALNARVCDCGFRFPPPESNHEESADTVSQVLSEPELFEVKSWLFSRHTKKVKEGEPAKPDTLRVTYFALGDLDHVVEEWVCLNHLGFAGNKANQWWREHCDENLDDVAAVLGVDRVDAAIEIFNRGHVRMPFELTIIREGRWWRVVHRLVGELTPNHSDDEWLDDDLPF